MNTLLPNNNVVKVRDLTLNADKRRYLVEVFREDWEEYDPEPTMSYYSLSYLGDIHAWHRHTCG
jgi:dTDP-4-dehydrorhamnose 3,5-epimerase